METQHLNYEVLIGIKDIIEKCYYVAFEIDYKKQEFSISNQNDEKLNNIKFKQNLDSSKKGKYKQLLTKYILSELEYFELKGLSEYMIRPINNNLIILCLKEKIEIKYCENIEKYISFDNKIVEEYIKSIPKEKPNLVYYRGNKLNFDLSTSLYRENNKIIEKEHIINNRIIQSMPNNFKGCENFFDKLTILKHFNCPSRLLDITKNPLIAAFFALDNYNSNTPSNFGCINYCFPTDYDKIKNSGNSDSVSLLSALCTTKKTMKIFNQKDLIKQLEDTAIILKKKDFDENKIYAKYTFIKFYINKLIENCKNDFSEKELNELNNFLNFFLDFINNDMGQKEKLENDKALHYKQLSKLYQLINSKQFFYTELQHQAALINPAFNMFLPIDEYINKYYIIHPSINNERIKNQQGLFIFIGSKQKKENGYYLKPNETYLELFEKNLKKRCVLIINNKDEKFYDTLSTKFGINKGFIYPEMEHIINQIKNDVIKE